eukprot:scaffold4599_cov138-Skeletonema_menzelii.AAC.8
MDDEEKLWMVPYKSGGKVALFETGILISMNKHQYIARSRGGGTSSFTTWPKVSHEYTGLRPLRFPITLTSKKLG